MSAKRLVLAAVAACSLSGCSWFTDFKQQPKIDPWESAADSIPPRGNPQMSVPVQGTAAPGFVYGRLASPLVVDSMSPIANPVPADARSLDNGRKLFQINCLPCHGPSGHGNGPATKYGMAAISIVMDITKNRTDGYIFGMIRNGRGIMPSYNRIEEHERWDVVNYVRALQGKLGAVADTTLVAPPGITGSALPSASTMGPTRPAPYYKHIGSQAGVTLASEQGSAPPSAPAAGATPAPAGADTTRKTDTTKPGGQP